MPSPEASDRHEIFVLAGPNGGGKSSVGGEHLARYGATFFDPDAISQEIRGQFPQLSAPEANSHVWREMVDRLKRAVDEGTQFAFETTLGGETITSVLKSAAANGASVRIWYVALDSADSHVARVRRRVA